MEVCNSDSKVKMGKGFRLRLSGVVPSLHCRSKEPATPYHSPSTSSSSLSYFHSMRQLVAIFSSMGCGSSRSCSTRLIPGEDGGRDGETDKLPENYFQWLKDEKWIVVAKLCHGNDDSKPRRKIYLDTTPLLPWEDSEKERAKRKKLRWLKTQKVSSQKKIERERLIASSSSSSRYDENDYPSLSTTPPRLSRFQCLISCAVEGKVRESFAVVKKSDDPYEDFKKSMLEMVVEKRMFERDDLERLLNCFLSLNSEDHHGVIVEAFSEVWRTLFAP